MNFKALLLGLVICSPLMGEQVADNVIHDVLENVDCMFYPNSCLMTAACNGLLTEESVNELDTDLRKEFKNRLEECIAEIEAITPLSPAKRNTLIAGAYAGRAGMLASMLFALYASFKATSNFHSSFVASDLANVYEELKHVEGARLNKNASDLLWKKMWKWVGGAALSAAGFVASVYISEKCAKKIEQHCSLTQDGLTKEQLVQNVRNALEIVKKTIEIEKN